MYGTSLHMWAQARPRWRSIDWIAFIASQFFRLRDRRLSVSPKQNLLINA